MRRLLIMLLVLLALGACAQENSPTRAVEDYLNAWRAGDENRLRELVCAEKESDIPELAVAFAGVEDSRMQDVSCTYDDGETVTCTGSILLQFDPERYSAVRYGIVGNELPLGSYRVVQEGGDWKWCGDFE